MTGSSLHESASQRICFRLRVRPDRLTEYERRHASVWPEMLEALTTAGWKNYSLFLDDAGNLIGYFECDDFEQSMAAMDANEVNTRWQREMAPFFADLYGRNPDEGIVPLREIFHLA